MNFNQKETGLLNDLKSQESLCVKKYRKYSSDACAGGLKNLFDSIAKTEQQHYDTINSMLCGYEPEKPCSSVDQTGYGGEVQNYTDENAKQNDAFLCHDALSTEKHVSGIYDVCIFEFTDTAVRDKLNHIQSEEQKHGELIYGYMSQNGITN